MRSSVMKRGGPIRWFSLCATLLALAGCASTPTRPPLYQWEGYPKQLYQYLRAPGEDSQVRIAAMEQDLQKMRAGPSAVPPGFHAHLAYLYLASGDDEKGLAGLRAEAEAFPEFTPYMQFLLARARNKP